MDLIDASNEPTPITKDPLTGNTIHPAPTQAIEDTPMDDGEIPNNNLPTTILDNRPTSYDFDTSPTEIKNKIVLLRTSISAAWGLLSPASAFPMQYLPDPDTHNWGLSLLTVLNQLAQMTQGKWKNDAIWHIIRHIKERNEVHGDTEDKGKLWTYGLSFVLLIIGGRYYACANYQRGLCFAC
jgi:hypothetical protein